MRIEHDGLFLSYEPPPSLAAGTAYELAVVVAPATQGTHVDAEWEINGGPRESEQAHRVEEVSQDGARYIVQLPAIEKGELRQI